MEEHDSEPHILFLNGITMADYRSPEDDLDEKLLSSVQTDQQQGDPMPFDEIPQQFTGLDKWPLTTNLKCWVCDFQFGNRPVFVPKYIRRGSGGGNDGGIVVGVLGNMCTFNCAERYIEDTFTSYETAWSYQKNLTIVYELFTGKSVSRIKPSPPKTMMRQYGGPWSEEEYWKTLRALDPEHGLVDHTLGSIRPERERDYDANPPSPPRRSVWNICGGLTPVSDEAAGDELSAGRDDTEGTEGTEGEKKHSVAGAATVATTTTRENVVMAGVATTKNDSALTAPTNSTEAVAEGAASTTTDTAAVGPPGAIDDDGGDLDDFLDQFLEDL